MECFLLPAEVDAITRSSDLTCSRLEKRGRFPPRIKIANRKIAWRKSDIEAWAAPWPLAARARACLFDQDQTGRE